MVSTILSSICAPTCALQNHSSGGVLKLEQACYDVKSYDISISVDVNEKAIEGKTIMEAAIVIPTAKIVVDLDSPYKVTKITESGKPISFVRGERTITVYFPLSKQPGDVIKLETHYSGTPHIARNAPWDGGFVWATSADKKPWISVALQGAGADLLFPCKDHPSDRPDKATMRLTAPSDLVSIGPGKLQKIETLKNGYKTHIWHMPLPINNYSLVFNSGPYELVKDSVKSIAGQKISIEFYVLPESKHHATKLIEEQKKYLSFMEKYCGPYPFRTVKMGIVETPHLGMEHSTAIAYGNKFRFAPDGLDWLLLHEFGHEWWANLVSNADWRDMWIHEGFQSYLDTLYIGEIRGKEAYFSGMQARKRNIRNSAPVAPREETSSEAYGGDIYDKGALILHSLRYLVGDNVFFKALKRMAYPTLESEKWADGRAMRLVTTDDFLSIVNEESGQDLSWFFEVYLRNAELPELEQRIESGKLGLRWKTKDNMKFPMPIDIEFEGKVVRVPMTYGQSEISFTGETPKVDVNGWVLRK